MLHIFRTTHDIWVNGSLHAFLAKFLTAILLFDVAGYFEYFVESRQTRQNTKTSKNIQRILKKYIYNLVSVYFAVQLSY